MSSLADEDHLAASAGHVVYNTLSLSASNPEVRLLEILAGDGSDPLSCKLLTNPLTSDVEYTALSYTWETSAPLRNITLNGQEYPVRQNLYAALARIRQSSSAVRVWVDAICINQDSIPERNAQVPLMRDIYSRAFEVFIWLGEGSDDTDHAMEAMHQIAMARHEDDEWLLEDLHTLLPSDMQSPDFPQAVRDARMQSLRAGLNDIFTRRWFDRTWTIQELALARRCPQVLCGAVSICWDCFHAVSDELAKYLRTCNMNDKHSDWWVLSGVLSATYTHRADALSELRLYAQAAAGQQEAGGRSRLARILSRTQHSLCTDPRDKIYGLLGIVEPEAADALPVDYAQSVVDLYRQTTMYLILRDGFNILSLQGVWPREKKEEEGEEEEDGWPSWIVDFRRPLPTHYTPLVPPYESQARYCTLPYWSDAPVVNFPRAPQGGVLQVRGVVVDRVAETSTTFKLTEEDSATGKHRLQLAAEMLRLFLRAGAKPPKDSPSEEPGQPTPTPPLPAIYCPRNRLQASPLGAAVLRTVVGDWIAPTYRHLAKSPGPPSEADMETLRKIVQDLAEEAAPLKAMGLVREEDAEKEDDANPTFTDLETSEIAAITERIMVTLNRRRAFRTDGGWIGAGPNGTQEGDYVVAVLGADVPFVFRIQQDHFLLVGECYVDGIMSGELLSNPYFRPEGDMEKPIVLYELDLH